MIKKKKEKKRERKKYRTLTYHEQIKGTTNPDSMT